jgi:hypothetical protein
MLSSFYTSFVLGLLPSTLVNEMSYLLKKKIAEKERRKIWRKQKMGITVLFHIVFFRILTQV